MFPPSSTGRVPDPTWSSVGACVIRYVCESVLLHPEAIAPYTPQKAVCNADQSTTACALVHLGLLSPTKFPFLLNKDGTGLHRRVHIDLGTQIRI